MRDKKKRKLEMWEKVRIFTVVRHLNEHLKMTMKQLTWRLVFPLTVISLATITKWWFVLPEDAPDTMMSGFPLAFVSDGWHTSMSLQFFIFEFFIDFLIYFWLSFLLIFCVDRYLVKVKVSKILTSILWSMTAVIFSFTIILASLPDQVIRLNRDWEMKILETGFKLTWKHQDRPDINKYNQSIK